MALKAIVHACYSLVVCVLSFYHLTSAHLTVVPFILESAAGVLKFKQNIRQSGLTNAVARRTDSQTLPRGVSSIGTTDSQLALQGSSLDPARQLSTAASMVDLPRPSSRSKDTVKLPQGQQKTARAAGTSISEHHDAVVVQIDGDSLAK